jgi:DNA-binding GntR family transcriptional regulator
MSVENRDTVDFGSAGSVLRRSGRPRTATDYVSAALRRSILNGELAGGTRLSLADLATTFDVSTTPVREALRELSFEGLVHIDSYRGGTVNAVTRSEVEEIIRIRQVLEPMAVRETVAGMTPEILAEAEAVVARMEAADTWDGWVQGNRAFHQKLYEAASSRRLIALIKGLQDTTVVFMSSTLMRSPDLRVTATRDHLAMVEAARTGDTDCFIEITLRHLAIPIST